MGSIKIVNNDFYTSIPDFYSGKSVFITGGTGFLGKVFIEKLLYSCSDIDTIFVLIREKNQSTSEERIHQLIDNPIFARLKAKRPQNLRKIVPIIGDIVAPNLGIKDEDEQILIEKVSVVIHSAATIKFNEPLSIALRVNLEGTKKVLELCKRIKNIQAFVHVSTAFSNTDQKIVEETVYPAPAQLNEVYQLLEQYGDNEEQTAKILNGRPNTYTFTKALAETYVVENRDSIPTVIIRPSIVTATNNEPLQGWLDNWNGSTGMLVAMAKGMLRTILADQNYVIDIIPVDIVSNLTIVAAARCKVSDPVHVYNCCTSSSNPITLSFLINLFKKESVNQSYGGIFPMLIFTKSKWILSILTFILQTVPAYIFDFCLRIRGIRPRYVRYLQQVLVLRHMLEYFTSRTWEMRSHRPHELSSSLSLSDRRQFPCDPNDVIWTKYVPSYCAGIKRYLLKEKKN